MPSERRSWSSHEKTNKPESRHRSSSLHESVNKPEQLQRPSLLHRPSLMKLLKNTYTAKWCALCAMMRPSPDSVVRCALCVVRCVLCVVCCALCVVRCAMCVVCLQSNDDRVVLIFHSSITWFCHNRVFQTRNLQEDVFLFSSYLYMGKGLWFVNHRLWVMSCDRSWIKRYYGLWITWVVGCDLWAAAGYG